MLFVHVFFAICNSVSQVRQRTEANLDFSNYHGRVDPQHSERIVQNVPNRSILAWLIQHQSWYLAVRVELVHVDGRVTDPVTKSREIPGQLQGSRRPHGVPDKALGIVHKRTPTFLEYTTQRRTLLAVTIGCTRGMRTYDVDLFDEAYPEFTKAGE